MKISDKIFEFDKIIEHAQNELMSVRTNRATPALIENLKVDVYGSKVPLIQIAGITSPETKQLMVEPWDKNVLKDVEKAIETAGLGLSVSNEGNFLRISMPSMTEETRKEILKVLNEKLEKLRTSLRLLRDKIKEEILKLEKEKEISEDEKYSLIEDLDKITREYTDKINDLGKKKEEEIKL